MRPLIYSLLTADVDESFDVHTGVILVGPTATGKSSVWKVLLSAQRRQDSVERRATVILPNLFQINELFGFSDPNARWKNGVLVDMFRDVAEQDAGLSRIYVFDGVIGSGLSDYLSSLLGPERHILLPNSDKLELPRSARLVFETTNLRTASPGLISQCGVIVFDDSTDLRESIIGSWLRTRSHDLYDLRSKEELFKIIERYVVPCFQAVMRIAQKTSESILSLRLTTMLDGIITVKNTIMQVDVLENAFVFVLIWTCGTSLDSEGKSRVDFSNWFRKTFPEMKIPNHGTVFDYFYESSARKFLPWRESPSFADTITWSHPHSLFLPTVESAMCLHFGSAVVNKSQPILIWGRSGSGKTTLAAKLLGRGSKLNIHVTRQSTSKDISSVMLSVGYQNTAADDRRVVFIDDLELASEEVMEAIRFAVQHKETIDYGSRRGVSIPFDSYVCSAEDVVAEDGRLRRLFTPLEYSPSSSSKASMVNFIVRNHLEANGFAGEYNALLKTIVRASIGVLDQIGSRLYVTPLTSHYVFGTRAAIRLANSFQLCTAAACDEPIKLVFFWLNEVNRTVADTLLDEDRPVLYKITGEIAKKEFSQFYIAKALPSVDSRTEPIAYSHFSDSAGFIDPLSLSYERIGEMSKAVQVLRDLLTSSEDAQEVVIYDSAVLFVAKIARLLALGARGICAIGPEGMGKGLLAKISAKLMGYRVESLNLGGEYSTRNFKGDWDTFSLAAGLRKERIFLHISEQDIEDDTVS